MKSDLTPLLTPEAVRMLRIERALRRHATVNLLDLMVIAGEVSVATLKRDLQCMRHVLGATIVYRVGKGYSLYGTWAGVRAAVAAELERA